MRSRSGAYFEWTHGFSNFLAATPSIAYLAQHGAPAVVDEAAHGGIAVVSSVIVVIGLVFTAVVFLGSRKKAERLARLMDIFGLYTLSYCKFFFDPIYHVLIVMPTIAVARISAWFDHYAVDGLVDFVGRLPGLLGAALRPVQNGVIQFYAVAMVLGLLVLLGALLM